VPDLQGAVTIKNLAAFIGAASRRGGQLPAGNFLASPPPALGAN